MERGGVGLRIHYPPHPRIEITGGIVGLENLYLSLHGTINSFI